MLRIDPKAVRLLKAELHQSLSRCLCESPLQVLLQVPSHDFPVFQRIWGANWYKECEHIYNFTKLGRERLLISISCCSVPVLCRRWNKARKYNIMGSVLGEGDLNSRVSLFSLPETIALGLFKYRVKMELKPFPQLFPKRNDSDLASGRIPIHSRPGRVLFLWVHFSERLGLFFSL